MGDRNIKQRPLRFFFGHHKGATTWVRYLVARLCDLRGDRWAVFDNPGQFGYDLTATVGQRRLDFVAFTNAEQRFLTDLPAFKGFHIVRDPRDTLVSAYFSHRESHPTDSWPELAAHREQLRRLSREDGLLAELEFSAGVFAAMEGWDYGQPHVLELKFEQVVAHPFATMTEAFTFLGMLKDETTTAREWATLALHAATARLAGRWGGRLRALGRFRRVPVEVLLAEVHHRRFAKLAGGRKPGEVDVQSHYRAGQPGDWRNHFTPKVSAAVQERLGPLCARLGYTA